MLGRLPVVAGEGGVDKAVELVVGRSANMQKD